MIDLTKVQERFFQSAIHWATTNQGYSEMREVFLFYLDCFVSINRHDRPCRLLRFFKQSIIDSLIRDNASSLTKAQQNKLRIVLERIGTDTWNNE